MYHFVDLTEQQRHDRRQLLDWFALVAQASAIVPLAAIQIYFAAIWIQRKRRDALGPWNGTTPPSSPHVKHKDAFPANAFARVESFVILWRRMMWWLGEEVPLLQSKRGEILFSALWTLWLLLLCVLQTGDDYLHLTKRLGLIPASQLPIHYLLSLKTPYSPISLLTHSSGESLVSVHQCFGRIITLFFAAHVALYTNFFVLSNLLAAKLAQKYIIFGYFAFIAFAIIGTTALVWVRQRNYRVFYVVHVTLSLFVLPALWIHVRHIRVYVLETVFIYLLNLILRSLATRVYKAQVTPVAATQNLVQITLSGLERSSSNTFRTTAEAVAPSRNIQTPGVWQAGHHAYIATASPQKTLTRFWNRGNPFTLASVPSGSLQSSSTGARKTKALTFVARVLKGSTTNLLPPEGQTERMLTIEGPYGLSSHIDHLLRYDRVLFVAGGVGGTFCVPLYQQLLDNLSPSKGSHRRSKVYFLWIVKNVADATWALPCETQDRESFLERLRIYVTGDSGLSMHVASGASGATVEGKGASVENDLEGHEGIEMEEQKNLLQPDIIPGNSSGSSLDGTGLTPHFGRPDLKRVLDQIFEQNRRDRIAIVTCGPKSLTSQLRREAGHYVERGREVFFWNESFAL